MAGNYLWRSIGGAFIQVNLEFKWFNLYGPYSSNIKRYLTGKH